MTPTERLAKIAAALTSAPTGMGASTGRDAPEWTPGDAYIIAYYGSGPEHVAVRPAATVECADVAWLAGIVAAAIEYRQVNAILDSEPEPHPDPLARTILIEIGEQKRAALFAAVDGVGEGAKDGP